MNPSSRTARWFLICALPLLVMSARTATAQCVTASPTNFNFGTRDIDAPASPEETVIINNNTSTNLDFTVEFTGNTNDFTLFADPSPLPANGSAFLQVAFAPKSQGPKSALVRVHFTACNGTNIDITLNGTGSSTVHHFVWDAIGATQFVGEPFPVHITAQDRNNETVASFQSTVKMLSISNGLTNTISFTPTNSGLFTSGSWTGSVTVLQPATAMQLLARDNPGHTGISSNFTVQFRDDLSLTVTDAPDPSGGQAITYVLTISNTGPGTVTGVLVTNTLSPAVNFVSATPSQGSLVQSGSVVVVDLGSLPPVSTASVSIVAEPQLFFSFATNLASVTRDGSETFLGNNRATNSTAIAPFGILVVTPASNFLSVGLTGGPFTPTNQIYTLSNAGTASLNWQVTPAACNLPPGIAGWWRLDGNASDAVSTNNGQLIGGSVYTNGTVGAAMFFDGLDDMFRIRAASNLNVSATGNGLTIEAWINPFDVSTRRPLVAWTNATQFWIDFVTNGAGAGSLYANIISRVGVSHAFSSSGGVILSNTWQHVAVTYNTNTGVATLYRNGAIIQQQNLGSFVPSTASDLIVGRHSNLSFLGVMDDVSVYNQALSQADIQTIYAAGRVGKCPSRVGTVNCNPPSGIVAWWPFDGNANDVIGTNNGTLVSGPVYTNGEVAQAIFFDGRSNHVEVVGSPSLDVGIGAGLTAEAWINPTVLNHEQAIVEYVKRSGGLGFHFYYSQLSEGGAGSLYANIIDTTDTSHHIFSSGGLVQIGVWQHVACTYDKASGQAALYLNGVAVAQVNLGVFTPQTSPPFDLFIGQRIGNNYNMAGALDELSIYNRALSASEIAAIYQAGSAGKCPSGSWYSFRPATGALAVGTITNLDLFLTPAATNLKVGVYFDSLSFMNTSNGRGSTNRIAQLNVLNRRPTLGTIPSITIAEDSGLRVVNFNGVSAGSGESQTLTVTANSDNLLLISNITVNYISPATNGSLSFTPLTNANGTAIVAVIVRDDASIFGGAFDAVTNFFSVTVTPVNDPPSLAPVPNQTVNEGSLLLITNVASDPDLPADILTFSMPVAPTNAMIDPLTGVVTWTPNELQGGTINQFTVVVADSGSPPLKATNQFIVTVLEVNSPPVLTPLADRVAVTGMLVSVIASATDPDIPANSISYSLAPGFPPGATVNSSNGLFTWQASAVNLPATNNITIIATDNGSPPLSDSKNFRIVIVERPHMAIAAAGTNVLLTWTALPGVHYAVQFKPNLQITNWSEFPGDVTTQTNTATKIDSLQSGQERYYQIRIVP